MMINKKQFNQLTKQEQDSYIYLWSALEESRAEKQVIEATERQIYRWKSELTGMDLIRDVEKNFKVENHPRYEMCLEDIEDYEKKLKRILAKLEG